MRFADPAVAATFTRDWHVHEMLFGYTGAVIVGYMIIAGANWTGHYPVAGTPVYEDGKLTGFNPAGVVMGSGRIDGRRAVLQGDDFGRDGAAGTRSRSQHPPSSFHPDHPNEPVVVRFHPRPPARPAQSPGPAKGGGSRPPSA